MTQLAEEERKIIDAIRKQPIHCVYFRTDDGELYIGGYADMGESDASNPGQKTQISCAQPTLAWDHRGGRA